MNELAPSSSKLDYSRYIDMRRRLENRIRDLWSSYSRNPVANKDKLEKYHEAQVELETLNEAMIFVESGMAEDV